MTDKLLTIIVPSYNMEAYLERGLSSLLVDETRLKLLDVLVVNDGSKDRTSEIGHKFESDYPGVFRVIDKENGHYGSCVNRGLKEARGTFVKVLDPDDAFDTEVFARYLDFLSGKEVRENADLILSDLVEVDGEGKIVSTTRYSEYSNPFSVAQILSYDRQNWFIHGLAYRTQKLVDMGYVQTEGMAYTDNEWTFFPMSTVEKCYRFNDVLYLYSVGREGQSVSDEVHVKGLGKEAGMVRRMIEIYPSYVGKINKENLDFLKDRLITLANNMYQLYLVAFKKYSLDEEPLKSIDALLKQDSYKEVYQATDNYTTLIAKIKFRPVRYWRRHQNLKLRIMDAMYKMADTLNKIRK